MQDHLSEKNEVSRISQVIVVLRAVAVWRPLRWSWTPFKWWNSCSALFSSRIHNNWCNQRSKTWDPVPVFFLLHYYLISYFTLTAVGKTVLGFFFDSILKLKVIIWVLCFAFDGVSTASYRVNGFEFRKWGVLCNFLSLLDNRPIKSLKNCLSANWHNYSSLDLYL